jgi:hypothetical protein
MAPTAKFSPYVLFSLLYFHSMFSKINFTAEKVCVNRSHIAVSYI